MISFSSYIYPKFFYSSHSLINSHPKYFPHKILSLEVSSPTSIEGELEAWSRRFNRWKFIFLPSKVAKVCGIHLLELVSPKEPFNLSQIWLLLVRDFDLNCPNLISIGSCLFDDSFYFYGPIMILLLSNCIELHSISFNCMKHDHPCMIRIIEFNI